MRALLWQIALVATVIWMIVWMGLNARAALEAQGMTSGFGFLTTSTSFSMGAGFFNFTPSDSYLKAFAVGVGNTLVMSAASIVTATLLGGVIGAMSLAKNPIPSGVAQAYVYLFRNTPQLLQIVFWYTAFAAMPVAREAISLGGAAFVSNRGLTVPAPIDGKTAGLSALALILGLLALLILRHTARSFAPEARWPKSVIVAALCALGPPLAVWALRGAPMEWSIPSLGRFNFSGGVTLPPEFTAIYFGLSFYIAAFIAEIVRGGIQGVDAGQIEAARTIGLTESQTMFRIIVPQALRMIIPPLTAQFISLLKNSSLGVAVGYPELFSISNTALTYSGRTIEVLTIMALIYLALSLAIGAAGAAFNRFVQYPSR
ncbi:amino acid ABC transporter permease [Paenirhodobacter populi]|uniref:amino acid ABC transporter permease n=1 Tax=Paenirhodobacter populi TaxID=2306993 RepID=UPI0013E3470E|nr:ABC transporter permease subunit [Sinirhodobacter populi]